MLFGYFIFHLIDLYPYNAVLTFINVFQKFKYNNNIRYITYVSFERGVEQLNDFISFSQSCFATVPPRTEPSRRLRATCNHILCYVITKSALFYL
jgi:hypothetical protein